MESNILDQLAAFDITKKINVSIYFEDSNEAEEVTNVINDDGRDSQDRNNLPPHFLDPRKEIKEELPEITEEKLNDELGSEKHSEQNIPQKITTIETENLQSRTNKDKENKRKLMLLQNHENKRAKLEPTQENIKNYTQGKEAQKNSVHISQLHLTEVGPTATIPSSNKSNEEREKHRIKSYIISFLTKVSENMRLVMEAYAYHRQYNTPYDSYVKQKMQYFNDAYHTVVKLIMPEIHNKEFILHFLHKTYQNAFDRQRMSKCSFRDYEILLKELINWAKKKQNASQATKNTAQTASKQENTVQPILASSNCCQRSVLESSHNKLEVHSTSNSDTICIFSGGSPGNEISINVNPNLSQHLSNNYFKNNEASVAQTTDKSSVDLPRVQVPFQTQPTTQVNTKNKYLQELLEKPPQNQPTVPVEAIRRYLEMHKYDTMPNQINKASEMQYGHTMIGQSGHLPPQSMTPSRMLPQNQHSINTTHKQSTLAPSSYGQSIRLQAPPTYVSTIWSQAWQQQVQPQQPELANFQHIQPCYDQSKHTHRSHMSQPQHHNNMLPQYGQNQQIQTQSRQFQNVQPQNGHVPKSQPQSIMPPNVYPHIQQTPPVLPECEKSLQIGNWHQGLNELYCPVQTQQQIHKNVPRTTSTDSGFISPLNFNTSSDQTVPPVSDDKESSQILITHVTSLNPDVPLMAEGNCVICKKTTKKVCMGCMKIYYCTYECQLQDWPMHGPRCYT